MSMFLVHRHGDDFQHAQWSAHDDVKSFTEIIENLAVGLEVDPSDRTARPAAFDVIEVQVLRRATVSRDVIAQATVSVDMEPAA